MTFDWEGGAALAVLVFLVVAFIGTVGTVFLMAVMDHPWLLLPAGFFFVIFLIGGFWGGRV